MASRRGSFASLPNGLGLLLHPSEAQHLDLNGECRKRSSDRRRTRGNVEPFGGGSLSTDVIWSGIIELGIDCNGNGVPDLDDIAQAQPTAMEMVIPDDRARLRCEHLPRLDAAGIPDAMEIAASWPCCWYWIATATVFRDACLHDCNADAGGSPNGLLDAIDRRQLLLARYRKLDRRAGRDPRTRFRGCRLERSHDDRSGLLLNTFAMFVTSQTQGYAFRCPGVRERFA